MNSLLEEDLTVNFKLKYKFKRKTKIPRMISFPWELYSNDVLIIYVSYANLIILSERIYLNFKDILLWVRKRIEILLNKKHNKI